MKLSKKYYGLISRITFAIFFAVLGFASSNRIYFEDGPLFKVPCLGESVIALVFGLVAVYLLPIWIKNFLSWLRRIIALEVRRIIYDYWTQQSKKMSEAKRKRQKEKKRKKSKSVNQLISESVILDTSVIIDGRILTVIKTGFLDNPLVVPSFVIDELQKISDSSEEIRRKRGRRGFEMLDKIGTSTGSAREYTVIDKEIGKKDVDKELIKLAKKMKAKIATVDFNMGKAAKAKGVEILNINDLAGGLRIDLIPGQKIKIEVVQKGKERAQGVGYLPDGTMIVVEDGGGLVGKKVGVTITRSLQTSAGRMFFARRVTD